PTTVRFPGGELGELRIRVCEALGDLRDRNQGEAVAGFTHAGVTRTLLAQVLSLPEEAFFRIDQRYGAVKRDRVARRHAGGAAGQRAASQPGSGRMSSPSSTSRSTSSSSQRQRHENQRRASPSGTTIAARIAATTRGPRSGSPPAGCG